MTALDLTAVALRRDPRTRFEGPFMGPDKMGRVSAQVDGFLTVWTSSGRVDSVGERFDDLIPLQTKPAPVRFHVQVMPDGCVVSGPHFAGQTVIQTPLSRSVEMIERAPADALRDAVDRWHTSGFTGGLIAALHAYDEATK